MRYLRDRTSHRRRIGALDDLIQLCYSQAAHNLFVRARRGNEATIVLDANCSGACG